MGDAFPAAATSTGDQGWATSFPASQSQNPLAAFEAFAAGAPAPTIAVDPIPAPSTEPAPQGLVMDVPECPKERKGQLHISLPFEGTFF